jgi:hypothetical protein
MAGVTVSIFDSATSKYSDGDGFDSAPELFVLAPSGNNFATWSVAVTVPGTDSVTAKATDTAGPTPVTVS